ncbi:DEAD/DEAH box helicase [Nannizzia gypsea CBS 118893]|uniref:DEAD/DEAH box helicase n=1 Tax=Arthroderma gypseum (strain ATCC MYA-4604 / CBS 118893) TaxID=535722 RepID=E4V5D5_ARTGP|nr:DEAD/DEAH box helicase [Nannizzia gypsea CBS 118893]EFR05209.1 DEAD/DEAH box helicase [Nannizzia gypsea CBS 118893]
METTKTLLNWYASLRSRTIDLVGDYAGGELFIIEGDSLLVHTFSDAKLDFNPGFQLLHATYILENFLRALSQRKCRFHIVFFNEHSELCLPRNTPSSLRFRFLLAREAIIQHLQANLPASSPSIEIKLFDAYRSRDFASYLFTSGAYFIMCHDGVFARRESFSDHNSEADNTSSESDHEEPQAFKDKDDLADESSLEENPPRSATSNSDHHAIGFRSMINWFIRLGYNIALINAIECRDTKVMAMIVEGSAVRARVVPLYKPIENNTQTGTFYTDHVGDSGLNSESSESESDELEDAKEEATEKFNEPEEEPNGLLIPITAVHGLENLEIPAKIQQDAHNLQELWDTLKDSHYADHSHRDVVLLLALGLMYRSASLDQENTAELRSMLLQNAILHECQLSYRAVPGVAVGGTFLRDFTNVACRVLRSDTWKSIIRDRLSACDLADFLDGRLFCHLLNGDVAHIITNPLVASRFNTLSTWLKRLCGVDVQLGSLNSSAKVHCGGKLNTVVRAKKGVNSGLSVLPFTHPVFNPHLEPVHLSVDDSDSQSVRRDTSRVFLELSHWHNHRRPIGSKTSSVKMTEREAFRANRRNQFFMAEMADYSASLTNASGGILNPETVFVNSAKDERKPTSSKGPGPNSKANEKYPARSNGKSKPSAKDLALAANEKRRNELVDKQLRAWRTVKANFHRENDLASRFTKVKKYLSDRPGDCSVALQSEIWTYLLSILVKLWISRCAAGERDRSIHIAAFVWDIVYRVSRMKDGLTPDIAADILGTTKALRLPDVELPVKPTQASLAVSRSDILASLGMGSVDIRLSTKEFQLVHAAPFFDRNMGSAPDSRVRNFEPDKWQRDVLDEIDANRSLFVVAPTSAGKTFISFYAMKKVLQQDDNGVLVYVAPTKALVNQVAAEIQARFSKSFKHGGKSVWAIHTRDYRINSPRGCQVLVTVPHILQIMLLAPANATSWSCRIKRIIFDEIHCISQADDGVVWEQLLLLAPCPIIALSATVGNPQAFYKWLSSTQRANGIDITMIEHRHRYSDLRKYVYKPPKKFNFTGLPDPIPFPPLGLDGGMGLAFMHPVACLVDRSRGMPDDLTLEPRDCWMLWKAMTKYQTPDFPVDTSLDPQVALPNIIRKVDTISWEENLKQLLKNWMEDPKSPFELVLEELELSVRSAQRPEIQISPPQTPKSPSGTPQDIANTYIDSTLPLICSLQEHGALPALFFNYDRAACETICLKLLIQLEEAEEAWKKSSPIWKTKLARWEAWKASQARQVKKNTATNAGKKSKKKKQDREDDEEVSQKDRAWEAANTETSLLDSFDPQDPVDGFHLTDVKKLTKSEFEEHAAELRHRLVPERLIGALRRGIGVHHAGMNRKYRQICEILFRKGYLRVVIATGTLALGINMPCKTVVFSGDSIFLTALNFRQAAGRAGRRGFDMLGNVVFQAMPYSKVCRLLSSRLPDLNGHFPVTTSLVLRLFILLYESKQASSAIKMVNSLLSCPHIYLGGVEARDTVLHHLRFSIEYLRRTHLLGPNGTPLGFAGCVSHLYFVENSSFAFHALLKDGYFHRLCRSLDHSRENTLRTLMLVMSHLFGRVPLRAAILENRKRMDKKSTSMIVLPPLPPHAVKILHRNNKEILLIFSAYAKTYVDQHVAEPDCILPLTGMKCGGDEDLNVGEPKSLGPVRYTSAFYALSGHHDQWKNISDLCEMMRRGVWLEKAVVPYLGIYPAESQLPLNAYLYDFFKHGNVDALHRGNGIRKGDVWFLLNDFSLVLATIVTSLENFLKLSPDTDVSILDAMGTGDTQENELDAAAIQVAAEVTNSKNLKVVERGGAAKGLPNSKAIPITTTQARKQWVADNWEDGEESDESDGRSLESTTKKGKLKKERKSEKKKGTIGKEKQQALRDESSSTAVYDGQGSDIANVLQGFKLLQEEFNRKFKAMWA